MPPPQDCQSEACDIQSCLTRTNYNEQKCSAYVDKLYKCCDEMYKNAEKHGKGVPESTACPIQTVVERRMKAIRRKEDEGQGK